MPAGFRWLADDAFAPKGRSRASARQKQSAAVASPKQLSRSASIVRVQAKALAQTTRREQERLEGAQAGRLPVPQHELVALLKEIDASLQWMAKTLTAPPGVPVEQAAERLGVTGTTVRKWLRLGLVEPEPEARLQRVSDESLLRLGEALARVRENFLEREWPKALAAYLHDRDLLNQSWVKAGVEALRRGRVVTLVE